MCEQKFTSDTDFAYACKSTNQISCGNLHASCTTKWIFQQGFSLHRNLNASLNSGQVKCIFIVGIIMCNMCSQQPRSLAEFMPHHALCLLSMDLK